MRISDWSSDVCASDLTGGSIRWPSAANGVVGIKPTFGRVSRTGVAPLAASLDHVGPIARTVEDAAILLDAIAGYDAPDPFSVPAAADRYREATGPGIDRVRVGYRAEERRVGKGWVSRC